MLNTLAEEPLKHTASLLQGTLLIDSEHLCGAELDSICDCHMTVNLSKFGWVSGGATHMVNKFLAGSYFPYNYCKGCPEKQLRQMTNFTYLNLSSMRSIISVS